MPEDAEAIARECEYDTYEYFDANVDDIDGDGISLFSCVFQCCFLFSPLFLSLHLFQIHCFFSLCVCQCGEWDPHTLRSEWPLEEMD